MKISIPNQNWVQANKGQNGSIFASWNLDLLSEPGSVKISSTGIPTLTNATGLATAFVKDLDTLQYALCGTHIFYWNTATSLWTALSNLIAANDPTLSPYYSDIIMFNGALIASLTTSVSRLASATWTTNWNSITLTEAYTPHPLCVGFNNLLLIGNGSNFYAVDTSDTVRNIVLPNDYIIEWIKSSYSGYWIGAKNKSQGDARVFQWDGSTARVGDSFQVGSEYCFSGVIDKSNVPYVINGYGQLMTFNGSGFQEVARLPVANSKKYNLQGYLGADGFAPIHRNGMAIIDGEVHILLNAGLNADNTKLLENQLSGIWCYTKENGLFHRFSLGKNSGTSEFDYGSPILSSVGALSPLPKRLGSFYAGANTYLVASGSQEAMFVYSADFTDTTRDKIGYLITPEIYSSEIEEMWNNITLIHKELVNPEDYIRVKYRFVKKYDDSASQTVGTGTWTGSDTFTVSSVGDLLEGDEIEILSGRGSGLSSKITDITGTTITIEDQIRTAENTFTFRSERWVDVDTIQDIESRYNKLSVDKNNTQIQFKVILFGKGDSPEIKKFIINSGGQIK